MKLATVGLGVCFSIFFSTATLAAVPQPLVPSGDIADISPTFKWTDTGAGQFTVEITKDESQQTKYVVSAPKLPYPGKLAIGVYAWRVKEGPLASAFPWSAPLAFRVLPPEPHPISPVNLRYPAAPTAPTFQWTDTDPDANRYTIQLYQDGNLLAATNMSITKDKTIGLTATWPATLPAGSYEWRIRATRKHANSALTLSGPWSDLNTFSVGVPLPCVITTPAANSSRVIGTYGIPIYWTASDGATKYEVTLLCNGAPFFYYLNLTKTNVNAVQNWNPGRYSIIVRPSNTFGSGSPSTPRNFVIERTMTPGNDKILASNPTKLYWARSADCTRYRIRLYRANKTTGDYDLLKEESIPQPLGQPNWKPGGGLMDPVGAYKWQVTDFDGDKPLYTTTDYFSIQAPPRPFALNPLDKTCAGLVNLDFTWKSIGNAATHYQLQVWKEGALLKDTGWQSTSVLAKATAYYKTYNLTANGPGSYMWRVRAKNTTGIGGWRQTNNKIAALAKPVITNPASDTSYPIATLISIRWPTVAGATHYEIQFWQNGQDHAYYVPAAQSTLQSYDWHVGIGAFTIRVRASDSGDSPWSAYRTITGLE